MTDLNLKSLQDIKEIFDNNVSKIGAAKVNLHQTVDMVKRLIQDSEDLMSPNSSSDLLKEMNYVDTLLSDGEFSWASSRFFEMVDLFAEELGFFDDEERDE